MPVTNNKKLKTEHSIEVHHVINEPHTNEPVAPETAQSQINTTDLEVSRTMDSNNTHNKKIPTLLWEVRNKEGYSPPSLYHPYDVSFIWDNRVVVVEGFWPFSRIQILDLQGKTTRKLAQGDILPFGITMDAEGYMAITDHKDRTVKFYTPDGNTALSWPANMFDWPDGITTTANDKYLIADWSKGQVSMHDKDGTTLQSFSTSDPAICQQSFPMYITVDKHNRILITDTGDRCVKIFDQSGKMLLKLGNVHGNNNMGCITEPRGICTDNTDNIIVADWGANCINKFSPDGKFIEKVLSQEGETTIQHPWGVAINDNGLLLVSEQKIDKKDPRLKMFQSCL